MSEQEKSVAHAGPQDEYNLHLKPPSAREVDEICAQMARMEAKYQEEMRRFRATRGK